jgi:urate oxidase
MTVENNYNYVISYGKTLVPVYRVYATPLSVPAVPESSFTGRENVLFSAEVDVEVFGENFLPSYTRGDNSMVVATDTMKNFILRQGLSFEGATLEAFLEQLGHQFLATYPVMERLQMSGREIPFRAAQVPGDQGHFGDSNVLFSRAHDDYGMATMDFATENGSTKMTGHQCGRVGMRLFKVTGSAFTNFVRDSYTTLPERGDRPLYIYLDIFWKYADAADMHSRYIASEQVRDVAQTVFHEFVSESIQHLMHEMGLRLLDRFPQMTEVSFKGNNLTRDPVGQYEAGAKKKVYTDPFPAYGLLKLTMSRKGDASGSK